LDSIVLFVGQTWFESRLLSKFESLEAKKRRNAHHNLVCRIEPMHTRQIGRVNVLKHQDQTRPDLTNPTIPQKQRSRNLISFLISTGSFFKN